MSMASRMSRRMTRPQASGMSANKGQSSGAQRLISTRGSLGGSVITTGKQNMTSLRVKICSDVSSIKIVYAGERGSTLPSGITVKGAVWKAGVLVSALTFSGSSSVTIAANAIAISDPVSVSLDAGDEIDIRTYATVASGSDHWGCQYLQGLFSDGIEVGATVTDKTTSGTVTAAGSSVAASLGFTPAGVIGLSSRPAVLIAGDSISIGTGDIWQVGYLGLAYERNLIPYIRTGAGGSTGSAGVLLIETDAQVRAMCEYLTDASWQYGVNSLSSGSTTSVLRGHAEDWLAELRTLLPNARASISTIFPVVETDNSASLGSGYWNSTKEAERVTYNNSLRAGLPTGFNYLWEAAGDATEASGLFAGAESAKDSGVFRSDFGTQNGFSAINDGLHPGRPLITAAAGAMDVQAFLGVTPLWGPEIAYATIPVSGDYAECVLIPNRHAVAETPGSITNITIGSSAVVLMSRVDDATIRLYCYEKIGTGTKSIVVSAGSNVVSSANTAMFAGTFTTTNNSTWGGSSDTGSVLASDDFNRADTSYNASTNNNEIGANWTDVAGNGAKITSNELVIQGQNSRAVLWNAANYTDVAAEIEFDPADFTADSNVPFSFKLGVRYNPTSHFGVFAFVNRKADLAALSRLALNYYDQGSAFNDFNATSVSFTNGTRYKLRIECSGTGGSKVVVARLTNATTGATIATVTGSSNLSSYPDAAGRAALISCHTAANDAATATASEVVVDSFAVRTLTDVTAPIFDSATLSDSGRYVDVSITELGLPLLPTSAAAGFTLSTGTISETVVFASDQVRLVLASTVSLPLTVSYSQAAGNITDQTANELTAFTDETVT